MPPHRKIEREIRDMLADSKMEAHSPFLSEMELSDRYRVNVGTVQKVLRNLEAEGLLYKIHRRGTFVAPPARIRQIVIVPTSSDYSIVGHLTSAFARYPNYQWLEVGVGDVRPHIADIRHVFPRLAGAMFVRDLPRSLDVIRGFQNQGVPTLFYGSDAHAPLLERTTAFLYRESGIIGLCLDHLLEKESTRFGFVGSDQWPAFCARHEHFRKWMFDHGLELDLGNFLDLPGNALHDAQARFDIIKEWIRSKRFTADAVLCANDQIATVFVQAALASGMRIPEQLKVVAIEDTDSLSSRTFPQVTAVRIPFESDVHQALDTISRMEDYSERIFRKWSEPYLIERSST